jgi:peptide chain release factor 2
MFEDESARLRKVSERFEELLGALNLDQTRRKIATIEEKMSAQNFWDDPDSAQKLVQEMKSLKTSLAAPDELRRELTDAVGLIEMASEEGEDSMTKEIAALTEKIEDKLLEVELDSLLSDPMDAKNAIVNVHPGAGGTESCDWASMLYRMITRFCERREFAVEVLDYQPGDEAGLKSATLRVSGPMAYGYLKSENGVHRLVRISPFDSQARRHTSFAAIEVLAEIDDTIEIEVKEDEIEMTVCRSGGAGGQHVNKTNSAVRLTHLPTGIVVACQIERSQHRNREVALQMLKAKLYDIEMKKKQAELDATRGQQQDVAWGSQIRSYVLHPYQLVKDHRTGVETGNTAKVLDGYLEPFIEGYLKWNLERRRN